MLWKSGGSNTYSTHRLLTNQSFYILFRDRPYGVDKPLNGVKTTVEEKYSQNARNMVSNGSVAPDNDETDIRRINNKDVETYLGHYCNSALQNKDYTMDPTAYTRFNNHYYNAKIYFSWGSYNSAYNFFGRAIHYLQDINTPPHADLITGTPHQNYEAWVQQNMRSDYYTASAPVSTYDFMRTTTFKGIASNFAGLASTVANDCVYYNSVSGTRECLQRAQRAVAGLAYRYLINTGRSDY